LGQKRRAEVTSKKARAKESKSEKTPDMDRRERHNERHRRYRAKHRQQEEERDRELAHLREFYGAMMNVNFEAVAFFEMITRYRDHPEALLEETIALEEILLNLR
jgi:hypothetical protein